MTLFGRWVMVDWSGASRPTRGPNSIWIADTGPPSASSTPTLDNPQTRHHAVTSLAERFEREDATPILVGVDASLSLPREGVEALAGAGASWLDLWLLVRSTVSDQPDNTNNRFEAAAALNQRLGGDPGPFWGHPPSHHHDGLAPTRPPFPYGANRIPEYRECEVRLRAAGQRVQSTWKIAYTGSVGGQFLTVIGALGRLREHLGSRLLIWPFETGFDRTPAPGEIWVCETWPGEFPLRSAPVTPPVIDADQVWSTVIALTEADHTDRLGGWLQGPLDSRVREAAMTEGWPLSPTLAQAQINSTKASDAAPVQGQTAPPTRPGGR